MAQWRFLKKQLNSLIKDAIIAAKNNGSEICGLMILNGYFVDLVRVKNKEKGIGQFSFYVQEIRFLSKISKRLDYEIIGIFHSHPYSIAEPSSSDIENALDDSFMLIIDVLQREAKLWHILNKKAREVKYELI